MGRGRPRNVEKLIADAQKRQVENAVVAFIKGIRAKNKAIRDANNGTRKGKHRQ